MESHRARHPPSSRSGTATMSCLERRTTWNSRRWPSSTRSRWHCTLPPGQPTDEISCTPTVQFPTDYPSAAWYYSMHLGQVVIDNASMITFTTTVCSSGRFHFVTKLAPEISASIRLDGANNRNQIAIYGQL